MKKMFPLVLMLFHLAQHLTITNWRLLWSLNMKPTRILGGHSKKIEKSYKFSQKLIKDRITSTSPFEEQMVVVENFRGITFFDNISSISSLGKK